MRITTIRSKIPTHESEWGIRKVYVKLSDKEIEGLFSTDNDDNRKDNEYRLFEFCKMLPAYYGGAGNAFISAPHYSMPNHKNIVTVWQSMGYDI